MRAIEDCYVYQPKITRTTKANSFVASGRLIYVVKKDMIGKALKVYNAYDKETGILLGSHWDKEFITSYIQRQDLSILPEDEGSLF